MNLASLVRNWWMMAVRGVLAIAFGVSILVWPNVPREGAGHWLLGTAGVSSLFLAILILLLPYAVDDFVLRVIAVYAQVFGAVLLLAAIFFPREVSPGGRTAGRYAPSP
jgi:uncharacterized membrane protein HdeD (DUF308 family)